MSTINQGLMDFVSLFNDPQKNQYALTIDGFDINEQLSVFSLNGVESLNQPWQYIVSFTCQNKQIDINSVLTKPASLTFFPHNSLPKQLSI